MIQVNPAKDDRNWDTDASESSQEASSDHEVFHESCWKRDRRIQPVGHIPRLPHDISDPLREKLTEKKELRDLLLPNPDIHFYQHCKRYMAYFFPVMDWFPKLV